MHNHSDAPEQELLSLEAAADFLFVSKSTMYRLLSQGKLRGMKAGKQWRFDKDDLLAYMQRGPAALALMNLPIEVLDAELAAWGDELAEAGSSAAEADDPALVGEAGKIAQLVRRMVWLLHRRGGSDLHLEPVWEAGQDHARLRMRVDGELREIRCIPRALYEPLVLEWKQRAGLALDETSRPQEGSARFAYRDILVPLRVSVVPTLYGERVAVRDIPTRVPSLADLGIADSPLRDWVRRPQGLILFTGPTGSGRSTTRGACVRELAESGLNIMAVEEQVEYLFPSGVTQLKVERFTAAEGVRAIMRQDPDVIIVGDLRGDTELARSAVVAAETGHLVLACMHAYDSISPLYDLFDAGVNRSLLAANVIGVVNQRLLLRLCDACKAPVVPDPGLLADIKKTAEDDGYRAPDSAVFQGPVGCDACGQRGYVGRMALDEYFVFSPDLKTAFLRGATAEELTRLARAQGQLSCFAAATRMAVEGATSLDEVVRRIPNWRG